MIEGVVVNNLKIINLLTLRTVGGIPCDMLEEMGKRPGAQMLRGRFFMAARAGTFEARDIFHDGDCR